MAGVFIEGLTTQLSEVKQRGEWAIRRDVLVKQHGLSWRQAKALTHVFEHGGLTIQEFEVLCPEVNRRTLQGKRPLPGVAQLVESRWKRVNHLVGPAFRGIPGSQLFHLLFQ